MNVKWSMMIALALFVFLTTKREPSMVELKRRYKIMRDHIPQDSKYSILKEPIPLTGFRKAPWSSEIGYNVNKGGEIGICMDQDVNSMMAVLIHELAHVTVEEYDHSKEFFDNMQEIRQLAIESGVYQPSMTKTQYCGGHISDKNITS